MIRRIASPLLEAAPVTASPTNQCDPSRRPADLAAVLFALGYPTLLTCVFFVALAGEATGLQQTVFLCGKTLQFLFPAFWVFAVQRRRRGLSGATGVPPVPVKRTRQCRTKSTGKMPVAPGAWPSRPLLAGGTPALR